MSIDTFVLPDDCITTVMVWAADGGQTALVTAEVNGVRVGEAHAVAYADRESPNPVTLTLYVPPHGRGTVSISDTALRHQINSFPIGARSAPVVSIPAGTILAWSPPPASIVERGGVAAVAPPQGWALCDGQEGRPDLTDRYLAGTLDPAKIGQLVGANQHEHRVSGVTDAGKGHQPYQPGTQFQAEGFDTFSQRYGFEVTSGTASSRPASVQVCFIIKL